VITLTASTSGASGSATYTWYKGSDLFGTINPITTDETGTYTVVVSDGGCINTSSTSVDVTINAIPNAPTGNPSQLFCYGATTSALLPQGTGITWYDETNTLLDGTETLENGKKYYAIQTVNG
jgi:hypothetical protein